MPRKIDISHKTVIFITLFILGLWVIYLIRDLLIILFIAIILMSALEPLVIFFNRLKIPRALGIAITYITIIAIVLGILAAILPPLVEQSSRLIVSSPALLGQVSSFTNIDKSVFQSEITSLSKNLFSVTLAAFDNFLTVIFLLVITFYLLLERRDLENRISGLFIGNEDRSRQLMTKIQEKLGSWLRGQIFLSIVIGSLSYLGLVILNVPFALPLSLVAAIMEVVPVIGPIISAVPAIFVALTISPILGVGVGVMYFIIQQMENHFIVPQVMKKAVGLNPLVVILTIAVGSRILGFSGALLAVPIAVVLQILVTEVIEQRKV